ncbi:MAG: dTDP-4-dehydrorhamnose 3,5-epimerase family protein [Deinococcales bacterium]
MNFFATPLAGCYVVQPMLRQDERGYFLKTFVHSSFAEKHLETRFREQYISKSRAGVIRGMHFQRPPHDHVKLVYCPSGRVLDAVVDLRSGSSTYGQAFWIELSAENATMLYIPSGFAHGFEALEEHSLMVYLVSSEYAPTHDDGIHWQSAGVPWTTQQPVVSARDAAFVALTDFKTPFEVSE